MGSEETRTDGGQPDAGQAGNVVRIPRDWFGPRDQLVPFGPGAVREGPAPDYEQDPNTFWGEDADSIQNAVEVPVPSARLASDGRSNWPLRYLADLKRGSVVSAVAVVVFASAGLAAWLLVARASNKPFPSIVASIGSRHLEAADGGHLTAPRTTNRARRPEAHLPRQANHHRGSFDSVAATEVVYHQAAPEYPPPPEVSYTRSASTTTSASSGSAAGGSLASAASSGQSSGPAFGPNGALGPMSSPTG